MSNDPSDNLQPINGHYPATDTFVPPDIFGMKHTHIPYVRTPDRPSSAKASGLPVAFLMLGLLGLLLIMMPKPQNPSAHVVEHIAERFINRPMYVAPTGVCGSCYAHMLFQAAQSGPLQYNYGYHDSHLDPSQQVQIQLPATQEAGHVVSCGPACNKPPVIIVSNSQAI